MGVTTFFIPQLKIDVWVGDGRIDFDGTSLGLTGDSPGIDLEPAVRFVSEVTGTGDSTSLVGKVYSISDIAELGADHYRDSVIIGDVAYQVVEGYIATPRKVITEVARTSYGNEPEPQAWKKQRTSVAPEQHSVKPRSSHRPKAPAPVEAPREDAPAVGEKASKQATDAEELARLLLEKL